MPNKKPANAKGDSLLIELLTEELPPKSLARLSHAFATGVKEGLKQKHFVEDDADVEAFATPRRLALRIGAVRAKQPDRTIERKGPSAQAGLGPDGQPTPALLGFARSCGVDVAALERRQDEKGEYFLFQLRQKGEALAKHLAPMVEEALKKLPVAKLMRWGAGEAQFVRPVHSVVLLHAGKIVPGTVLGLTSGNTTLGHRFLSKGAIVIRRPADYEKVLAAKGRVVASFAQRRDMIVRDLDKMAAQSGKSTTWRLGKEELVDEVTSIVESPRVYQGSFDASFLEVPRECLIISMQQHQKYFPLADAQGKLLPQFLFVANMHPADSRQVVHGNERVLRARLSDAKFFYDQDRKHKLEERIPRLAQVVYHNKLGSQLDRVRRLEKLARGIAQMLGADGTAAARAAQLCKADLLTDMVGEFPELQGTMGRYYARHDGEPLPVAEAIGDQYRLRFDEASNPENLVSAALYLAERIDAMVGFFGIGQAPTGDKDPFALRRAALGLISAFEVLKAKRPDVALPDAREMLEISAAAFAPGVLTPAVVDEVQTFILERYWHSLASSYPKDSVEAVVSQKPKLSEVRARVAAVEAFRKMPEAGSLAAANKRIRNILRKSDSQHVGTVLDEMMVVEDAERVLITALRLVEANVSDCTGRGDYTGALRALAGLRGPVDGFFDKVMVNTEDARVRANRHALLKRLDGLMNQVADISKLAA